MGCKASNPRKIIFLSIFLLKETSSKPVLTGSKLVFKLVPNRLNFAVFLFTLLEKASPFAVPRFARDSNRQAFSRQVNKKNSKNSDKGLQFKIFPQAKI